MVEATFVEFLVWLRNFAQAEMRALLGCRRGFVNPLTQGRIKFFGAPRQ